MEKGFAILLLLFSLTACVNGNALVAYQDGTQVPYRVSSCQGDNKTWLQCTSYGMTHRFEAPTMDPQRVTYQASIWSYQGADFCSELNLFCGKEK